MIDISYLNGARLSSRCIISLTNPSFLYGINCFEGIRGYYISNNKKLNIIDFEEHVDRLIQSLHLLEFNIKIHKSDLMSEIRDILNNENILENVYIRLTYFLDDEVSWRQKTPISYTLNIKSIKSYLGFSKPIMLGISKYRRISADTLPPTVKAGANYLNSRYALLDSEKNGFDGTLLLNKKGFVSESSGSCIFFIKGGEIYTPSIDSDILVGVTRNRIISIARNLKISVHEIDIDPLIIPDFDFSFLAGTMIEIKPLLGIDLHLFNKKNQTYDLLVREYIKHTKGIIN